jgi:murein DD-endopeptidase MepM/ murein hydrolase activator NlpD
LRPQEDSAVRDRRLPRARLHLLVLLVTLTVAVLASIQGPSTPLSLDAPTGGAETIVGALQASAQDLRSDRNGLNRLPPATGVPGFSGERVQGAEPIGPLALATPIAAADCQPLHPAYCVYTVRPGDTLSEIALRFNLANAEVLGADLLVASNKPDITSIEDFIQPDQKLRIPTRRGVVQTIILGETVGDLAVLYDVSSAEIIAANALVNADLLQIGQTLLIPNPKRVTAPEQASSAGPSAPAVPLFAFAWPLNTALGRITNYFTPRHPLGIDIGLARDPRAPVYAVEAGTVAFAGGETCCSYGLYVIVDHGNGFKTLYAHLSEISVSKGQPVSKGTRLGTAGSTGYSTGTHLHFEVHLDGKRVDPMRFLP